MVEINDQEKVVEISEYKNIYKNEDSHFFYTSTHYLVEKLIRRYIKTSKLNILDAGCGTGGLMKKLSEFGRTTGIDFSREAMKYAKKRGLNVRQASIQKIPFGKGAFDVVTSIDVLYHLAVTDDIAALRKIKRVLKPDGTLILRVPANNFLMSAHDRHVHTARRYSKKELRGKLLRAGFKIKFISYIHAPIFPISFIRVMIERLTRQGATSMVGKINPILNMILGTVLRLEAEIVSRGVTMPFGQGLIAVATA